MRIGAWLLAAVFLLAALPAPVATGAAATPAAYGFQDIVSFFTGTPVTLREIAWHPSGEYALIAGGLRGPATDPTAGYQLLLKYENATGRVTPVLNASRMPMLFAVEFAPDGSHALAVGEKDTILRYDARTGEVRNLFAEFQAAALANDPSGKPPVFQGRGLAYNTNGKFAIITGQEMIFYNDTIGFFTPTGQTVKPAGGGYYKAAAFSPDGSYAIVEGGDTYPKGDLQGREGQARIGQLWFMGLTQDRCARYLSDGRGFCLLKFNVPYGYFEPDRSDPSDITFHPRINASFVYGYDDKHGTILRIRDNGTAPSVKQPKADYLPEWMAANHKDGKYTDMDFRPHGTRALVTAWGDPSIVEFDGLSVRPLLDAATCLEVLERKCGSYSSVAWHPSGAYAVAVGLYGDMLKVVPQPYPELELTHPTDAQTVVDSGATTLLVQGSAYATVFGTKIRAVKVAVDGGEPFDANVSTRFNPSNWRYRWNVSGVTPGPHTLTVYAEDTLGHRSPPVNVTIHVALPPPPLDAPTFTTGNLTSRLGDFTLTWSAVEGAASYLVQDSRDPDFAVKVTWPVEGTSFESLARDAGLHYFRVQAVGAPRPTSEWSETLVVNVTEGRRASTATDPDAATSDPPTDIPDPDAPPVVGADANTTPDDDPPTTDGNGTSDPPGDEGGAFIPGAGVLALLAVLALAARRRP